MEWILLVLIGLAAGTLGSLVGLGGGIITVPALIYLHDTYPQFQDISPQVAVGTSLVVIVFSGLSSTLAYMRQKFVDFKSGLLFFIGSGPGGMIGSWLNKFFNVQSFSLYFGIFIIFISLVLMLRGKIKPLELNVGKKMMTTTYINKDGTNGTYGYQPLIAIFLSFFVGLLGGMFGVGGGSLMVPVMILLFAFPPHLAVATSMLVIFLSSMTSSITHITMDNIDWMLAVLLIPGAWLGGKLGSYINGKLNSKNNVMLLRLIFIIIGVRLIYQGITY